MFEKLNEFQEVDVLESEIKQMVLFSVFNKIPLETVLKMPRSRYEETLNIIKEYNENNKRDSSLLNSIGASKGGLIGNK